MERARGRGTGGEVAGGAWTSRASAKLFDAKGVGFGSEREGLADTRRGAGERARRAGQDVAGVQASVEDPSAALDASDVTESEEEEEEDEDGSWIRWFCSIQGHEFFCEVDEDFIQDNFNLSGLSSQVPYYEYALDMILDADAPSDDMLTDGDLEYAESAAEMLYGLIHARYILTARGLQAMLEKYKNVDMGRCPRVFCSGQPLLPVGQSDIPRVSTVKLFCPKCQDIYYPRSKYQGNIDGAYFGTTFPHLFFMTYSYLKPPRPENAYVPRIFGFRIHPEENIEKKEDSAQNSKGKASLTLQ